jgi:hypothetical protein
LTRSQKGKSIRRKPRTHVIEMGATLLTPWSSIVSHTIGDIIEASVVF